MDSSDWRGKQRIARAVNMSTDTLSIIGNVRTQRALLNWNKFKVYCTLLSLASCHPRDLLIEKRSTYCQVTDPRKVGNSSYLQSLWKNQRNQFYFVETVWQCSKRLNPQHITYIGDAIFSQTFSRNDRRNIFNSSERSYNQSILREQERLAELNKAELFELCPVKS